MRKAAASRCPPVLMRTETFPDLRKTHFEKDALVY